MEIWAGSRYQFLKALMIGLLRVNGERSFIFCRADVGGWGVIKARKTSAKEANADVSQSYV